MSSLRSERDEADLGDYLQPPAIPEDLTARSQARVTRIRLGEGTVNTCNPGIGDVDGDGLDEIAIPFNRGEQDVVALFRGDGTKLWENTDIQFYHAFYNSPERYKNTHWHYRSRHRHLLTAICDIDGNGKPEVIVGDGPLYILNAQTGRAKAALDLDGCVQLWSVARLEAQPQDRVGPAASRSGAAHSTQDRQAACPTDSLSPETGSSATPSREAESPAIVACVNHHEESGEIIALRAWGELLWRHDTVGKSFEDKMLCGDLTGDGLDEIAFSMADAKRFEVRDAAGEVLWAKNVPDEIGEDTHVDDLRIAPILEQGNQLATSTGGCLFDASGKLIWRMGDRIDHGQKIAVASPPGYDGPRIYINSKTGRRAYLLNPQGEVEWEYDNFSATPDRRIYLTTAGDWVDWSAPGAREIVQSEILVPPADLPAAEGAPVTLYLTILSPDGSEVAKLPYEDTLRPGFNGAMCAIACHARTRDRQDIVVIMHNSGEALIFSPE